MQVNWIRVTLFVQQFFQMTILVICLYLPRWQYWWFACTCPDDNIGDLLVLAQMQDY